MFIKNGFLSGILIAAVFPFIAWVVDRSFKYNTFLLTKPAFPYLAALALNLLMLRFCLQKGYDKSSNGIMAASFLLLIVFLIIKIHPLR